MDARWEKSPRTRKTLRTMAAVQRVSAWSKLRLKVMKLLWEQHR